MSSRHLSLVATSMAFMLQASNVPVSAQTANPLIGTWQMNVAKSTFSPGPPWKSQTRTYEASGEAIKYTFKGVDSAGTSVVVEYTAAVDGKDHPITGTAQSDTIAFTRVDANTATYVQKKAGKVVITGTRSVSKDGITRR